jgi:Bacterial Ig-like domain (group 2).
MTGEDIVYNYDVSSPNKKPKLNKTSIKMSIDDTEQLGVLNTNKKVKWSSSNKKVVKVNNNGKVTPVWFGAATISAKVANKTLKCKVKVLEEDYWYSEDSDFSVSIMPLSAKKARVRIYVSNEYGTLSSGDLIGKYNKKGTLIMLGQGIYNISAGIMLVEKNSGTYCCLVVSDADEDSFITDDTVLDIKSENS